MIFMVKSKKTKIPASSVTSNPKRRPSRFPRKARSVSRKSGMRWGEVALSALVGYEGDKILDSTGLIPMLASKSPELASLLYDQSLGIKVMPGQSGITYGGVVNKDLGFAALLKAGYDVIRHKKLSEQDKNILIPFAIGTVFDGPSKSSESSGVWK